MEMREKLEIVKAKMNGLTNDKWDAIKDKLEMNIAVDNLRKGMTVGELSGYNIIKYYEDLLEKQCVTEDDKIAELEALNKDIRMNTQKLRDQRRELKKLETSQARYENLRDYMVDCMSDLPPIELKSFNVESKGNTSAVLSLSDWHCGALVDNQFNYYDVATMIERVEVLKSKVIKYSEANDVSDLYVEINGDMVEGLIHVASRVAAEEDVVEQIVTVSEVLSQLINDLKPSFNKITVITTLGNHGRVAPSKNDTSTKENFEMLIPVFLKQRLKDVTIIKSHGEDFVKYNIGNKVICLAHGQNDKLNTVVADFCKMYKEVPNEVHLGHTHAYKDINDCDIMVTVNGTLKGSDDYALTLRKVTKPSQVFIVYGDDRITHNIIL